MRVIRTDIAEVMLLEPRVFGDARGFFLESYNRKALIDLGIKEEFVQDNHSRSIRHVLRGIHYQITRPQGKLVRVVAGEVFDVAVDLRRSSPTFGRWTGFTLSAENKLSAWIPPGFGHGFLVLSETADFLYKTTDYYAPEDERCLLWNDTTVNIRWPITEAPLLSQKDRSGKSLRDVDCYP